MPPSKFNGFDPDTLRLLERLPGFDKAQYDTAKQQLKAGIRDPGWQLIAEVAERLSSELSVQERSSVSPLHRDLRFAPQGASRYKDHLLLTTWQGLSKKSAPTLWLRIAATGVGFASSIPFTPAVRDRWREKVGGESGLELANAIQRLRKAHEAHGFEVAGDLALRVPKPWDLDHPRQELLRLKSFQVRFQEPLPQNVGSKAFLSWCKKRMDGLMPVHNWLVEEL